VACISDRSMFKLLGNEAYEKYKNFATEERMRGVGGVTCPLPKCHNAIFYPADESHHLECPGCGRFFCRICQEEASQCRCVAPKNTKTRPPPEWDGIVTLQNEKFGKEIQLQIRNLANNDILMVNIREKYKVGQIKNIVSNQIKIHPSELQIIYAGLPLEDDTVAQSLGFSSLTVIHLVIRHSPSKPPPPRSGSYLSKEPDVPVLDGAKKCPSCKRPVLRYKKHRCHHVECICGHHFCFLCLKGGSEKTCGCVVNCTPDCPCPICPSCKPGRPCDECQGCSACTIVSQWGAKKKVNNDIGGAVVVHT